MYVHVHACEWISHNLTILLRDLYPPEIYMHVYAHQDIYKNIYDTT